MQSRIWRPYRPATWLMVLAIALMLALMTSSIAAQGATSQPAPSAPAEAISAGPIELTPSYSGTPYTDYIARHRDAAYPEGQVSIDGASYTATNMDVKVVRGLGGEAAAAVTTGERGYIQWKVNVPVEGLYNIELKYYPLPGRGTTIERELRINGEVPFSGADALVFHRIWGDESAIKEDTAGNQVRSRQIEKPQWRTIYLTDPVGYIQEPYSFFFHSGENTITLVSRAEPMAIQYIKLTQVAPPASYADVSNIYAQNGYQPTSGVMVKVQGELATYRSNPSLFPVADPGDPTMEPYDPALIKLNSIGGFRWQIPKDWIIWEFEVPQDGLYKIAIKGKQDLVRGFYSNRRVYIDGKVPFAEVDAVKFPFTDRYSMTVLGGEDTPYLFYLTKGKHQIELEVTLGDLAGLLAETEDVLYDLTSIYRNIIMITSGNPDPLRSYQIEKRIPDLIDRLSDISVEIDGMAQSLEDLTGQKGGQTATLRDLARLLRTMAADPERVPSLLGAYRDGIGSLGTWVMNSRNQPLQIDYLVVASPEMKMPRSAPTVGQTLEHEVKALIASFTHDYNAVSDISDQSSKVTKEPIKVWIGWGRDQAMILKQMLEDSFTPETGIPVDLELVTNMHGLLIPSTLAGTAPDVALGAIDMDLAYRGAIADLAQFPDFEEVASRFKKSALVSCTVRDKVYGLPETQSFPVLFYRKDIFDELGLKVPQTWDDLYEILPDLQKKNMTFGIGPSLGTFQMLLYQKGVPLYKEDMVETNLESEAAIKSLKEMSDFYTLYMVPVQFDFQNRFRMGEMPLGIADYTLYNTLQVAAPELRGKWGFTLVPGTVQDDGTVNHAVAAGSSGAIILQGSKKKDEAWEFLKWWTRTDIQARYGRELEALMGAAARYATANVDAMQQLPWRVEERNTLLAQWDWVEGTPPVLGGYYVTRQFDWLFRAVYISNRPVRESVIDYNRVINEEIARKREEYHYETRLEDVEQRWKDLYWEHYTILNRLDFSESELSKYLTGDWAESVGWTGRAPK